MLTMSQGHWQHIAAEKRKAVEEQILLEFRIPKSDLPPEEQYNVTNFPRTSGLFSEKELDITDSNASRIVEKIASRIWSAEEVTRAFCKRAAAAQQLTNCLTTFFPDEAISMAKKLDVYMQKTGRVIGPLHGLPVSLKDNFNIVGKDSTIGFASLVGKPAAKSATLVDILEKLGAVRYCKTNVPTAMMIAESVNNVFGRTVNPLDRRLTSGGSSGGESALIAFRGSPLGVGTDIGGSLRIPAACTGIFTLRPSFGRFTTQGCQSGMAGQEAVPSVNGPMARSLEDIILFAKSIVDSQPWRLDPKVLPIPWRPVERKMKLKLAILWNDGSVQPTPPVTRALHETVDKLKKAGHTLVQWEPVLLPKLLKALGDMFVADGGQSIDALRAPTSEPWRSEMSHYEHAQDISVYEMWKLHLKRSELQRQFLEQWESLGELDGILAPTTPYSSVKHGNFQHIGYTGVFNVVDYPAVSFPCGINADREKDGTGKSFSAFSTLDQEVHDNYDPNLVHGMPVSLQLIARRLHEEEVLSMTETVLQAIRNH